MEFASEAQLNILAWARAIIKRDLKKFEFAGERGRIRVTPEALEEGPLLNFTSPCCYGLWFSLDRFDATDPARSKVSIEIMD